MKSLIQGSHANINEDLVQRYGKILQPLNQICHDFKAETGKEPSPVSNLHSHADIAKDLKVATRLLYFGDIFTARGKEQSPVTRNSDNRKTKLRPVLFKRLKTKEKKAFATWLEQITNFPAGYTETL